MSGTRSKSGDFHLIPKEVHQTLPSGWEVAYLTELIATDGVLSDGDWVESKDQDPDGDVRLVQLADVGDAEYRDRSKRFLTSAKAAELRCTFLEIGDLLVARLPEPLGRVCRFPGDSRRCVTVVDVCIIRPGDGSVSPQWLMYVLNSPWVRGRIAVKKAGSGRIRISKKNLTGIPLPIPPWAEQERIADRMDELFTDLSAGVAALERVKRNLSRYRAAVLHAAVTGRLTEAWRKERGPADEPGPKLLERILAERRRQWEERTLDKYEKNGKKPPKNWKSRYPEPADPKPLIDGDKLPPLPRSWCWASADQLGWVQLGRQRSPKNRSDKFPTKYIRAANITEDGLDLSDVLDMEFQPHELEVYRLIEGDIVLSEASGSATQVGKPAVWRDELPDCAFQNTVIRLRPTVVGSEYLYTFFLYCYRCRVFATVAGGVGINHLSADKFSRIPVALPPMAEQAAIVEAVHEKLSQIDALEGEVERGLRRAGRLRQAILKAAFEGTLVPQNPGDEPASVLLERMRSEAASAEPKRARKPRKKSAGKVTAS